MGSMTPMLDDAAREPEQGRDQRDRDRAFGRAPTMTDALAALELAVAHLATCDRCRLDLSCVDGAHLGEAAAWLWHRHRDQDDTHLFGHHADDGNDQIPTDDPTSTDAMAPDPGERGGG
jgi:hypothetical protein